MLCAVHELPFGREERSRLIQIWGKSGVGLLKEGLQIDEALAERMYKAWERIDKRELVPLVPGAREVFLWLRKNGFATGLLTTRRRKNLTEVLDGLGITNEFSVISSGDDTPNHHKPDPRAFRYILEMLEEKHGIDKSRCIFIGDTRADIEAGLKAGIVTLAVQTGPYLLRHVVEHPIPLTNILGSIDELPGWLEEHHDGELSTLYK